MRAQDKQRENLLDSSIRNPLAPEPVHAASSAKPFDSQYDPKMAARESYGGMTMVEIVEKGQFSSKRYSFNPVNGIYIGSGSSQNNIVLLEEGVSELQCVIKEDRGAIVVRNIGNYGMVELIRRRNRIDINNNLIEMKNGDVIRIGKTFFTVNFTKI